MIRVQIPDNYQPERYYILSVMLEEFLGLDIAIELSNRNNTRILIDGKHELVIADGLFSLPCEQWLQKASLPKQPLKIWNLETIALQANTINHKIPVIYGDDQTADNFFSISENRIYLGLDIFGTAFFMLTRYEEVVKPDRDQYDRFPAKASLAYQEGFLERPIVNEYLEILWSCMKKLWPKLERRHRQFQLQLSHDVDNPFELNPFRIKHWLRRLGGDLLIRRDLRLATSLAVNGCFAACGLPYQDRLDSFDWIMDQSESIGVKSAFYFICGHSQSDPRYDVNSLPIRNLIRHILMRGHEVGLHPSYDTYLRPDKLEAEAKTLRRILVEEGVANSTIGGRQHYLRWKAPETWQYWSDAALSYDSTLTYAENPGFRCGICYEYPVFNLKTRQSLKLREHPLIVMECSLLSTVYRGLSHNDAEKTIEKLLHTCQKFQGYFTILWHNSEFLVVKNKKLYTKILHKSGLV